MVDVDGPLDVLASVVIENDRPGGVGLGLAARQQGHVLNDNAHCVLNYERK